MFKITIEGETLDELWAGLNELAVQMAGEPIPAPAKPAAKKAKPAAKTEDTTYTPDASDDEEPDPLPETAKAVVDAGTGKPQDAPEPDAEPAEEEPATQMTMDDVRASAAKLAASDSTKLSEILKSYGAGKLSEVPKGKLADFAGDVVEALG